MPSPGEGIPVTHPIQVSHLGDGMYLLASLPDTLGSIYYTDMAPPLAPSKVTLVFPDPV